MDTVELSKASIKIITGQNYINDQDSFGALQSVVLVLTTLVYLTCVSISSAASWLEAEIRRIPSFHCTAASMRYAGILALTVAAAVSAGPIPGSLPEGLSHPGSDPCAWPTKSEQMPLTRP